MSDRDLADKSLSSLVDLQEQITRELKLRFERPMALMFTDVVGSTAYIAEHGDVAGRTLLQRHHKLLRQAIAGSSAWIVDTAGDGAFLVAETAFDAALVLANFQRRLLEDNAASAEGHHLEVRSGLHWGAALVDDRKVTGKAVHTAARIAHRAQAGEIRLSDAACQKLPVSLRMLCHPLKAERVKGIPNRIEMLWLDWRDPERFPTSVEIVEVGQVKPLPIGHRVTFGRLAEHLGKAANDIVLTHTDQGLTQRISRWHLELEMTPEGYLARALSPATTEVDGQPLAEGETAAIRPGSTARLAKVLTLRFLASPEGQEPRTVMARPLTSSDLSESDQS